MPALYDASLFSEMMLALYKAGRLPLKPMIDAGIRRGPALDIGCGPGVMTLAWAMEHPGQSILGLDADTSMLHEARQMAGRFAKDQALCMDPVLFQEGDAQKLPFADASFASVFSVNTLHEVPDPTAMLAEIHRVLIPGGAYCIRDLHQGGDWTTLPFAQKLPGIERFRPMVHACLATAFSADRFTDLVQASPLRDGTLIVNPMLLAVQGTTSGK